MENKDLISIIVPTYNVEKYLNRCIDSILNQDYSHIEIIIVNDGSTDTSGEIAEEYAQKDSRVMVYHKINGGLSDARNFGIEKTRGKYITFIDADDWVNESFISILYRNLMISNADISGCVFKRITSEEIHISNEMGKIVVWDSEEALKKMLRQEDMFTTSACALLYDTNCFANIRYPLGKYFEDLGTTYKLISRAKRIVHTNQCLYYYYMRDDSISNSHFRDEYMDEYYFAKEIEHFVRTNYPRLIIDAQSRVVGVCFHLYMMIDRKNRKKYSKSSKLLIKTIKMYRLKMIFHRKIPRKVKCGCIFTMFGMPLTSLIYKKMKIKGSNNC